VLLAVLQLGPVGKVLGQVDLLGRPEAGRAKMIKLRNQLLTGANPTTFELTSNNASVFAPEQNNFHSKNAQCN
jgi:hypothetical protein